MVFNSLLIATFLLAASAYSAPQCGVGEKLNKCPGTCNEPACGDYFRQICVWKPQCPPPACECASPYVRNGTGGACIKRTECPSKDGNEEPIDSDEDDYADERPQNKKGKRNAKAPQCGFGEKMHKCPGMMCNEPACGDHHRQVCLYVQQCPQPTCDCIRPYVRNGTAGACIKRTECPSKEGNEEPIDSDEDDYSDEKPQKKNGNAKGKKRASGSIAPSGKAPKCAVGETLNRCPGMCNEPACGDDGQLFCVSKPCPPPACTCALSLVRNGTGGACIKRNQYPDGGKIPLPDSYEDDYDSEENSQKKKKGKGKGKQ